MWPLYHTGPRQGNVRRVNATSRLHVHTSMRRRSLTKRPDRACGRSTTTPCSANAFARTLQLDRRRDTFLCSRSGRSTHAGPSNVNTAAEIQRNANTKQRSRQAGRSESSKWVGGSCLPGPRSNLPLSLVAAGGTWVGAPGRPGHCGARTVVDPRLWHWQCPATTRSQPPPASLGRRPTARRAGGARAAGHESRAHPRGVRAISLCIRMRAI